MENLIIEWEYATVSDRHKIMRSLRHKAEAAAGKGLDRLAREYQDRADRIEKELSLSRGAR